jgi:signal transduction histidine kinase
MWPANAHCAMQPFSETQQNSNAAPASQLRPRSAKQSLVQAFHSFAHVAGALENSYSQLQAEVARLRQELESANLGLNQSLEENKRIRLYLTRTLDCLPCGVLVVDENHKLKLANTAAHGLLGTGASSQPTPGTISREVVERLEAVAGRQSAGTEREWPIDKPDGPCFLAVSRAALAGNDKPDGEWIFILRDITESKRLEKEREVAHRTHDLAQMAMLLAHEVRNPLGSLELFAGLLAEATEERPVLHEWVDQLQAGLRTLSATVNNVLQFHSEPRSELTPVNMVSLLKETVEFLRPLAWQRSMRLELRASEPEIFLRADAHRLQQVFFNLALNAFRAMSPGGALRVSVHCSSQAGALPIEVVFRDEGIGIPAEHLARIFEAGFTTNPASPGLGLALTKKVVEQHQGTIRVESVPGKGTTFVLSFPSSGAGDESGTGC